MVRAPSWSFEALKRRGEMIARLEAAGVPIAKLQVASDAELERMVATLPAAGSREPAPKVG